MSSTPSVDTFLFKTNMTQVDGYVPACSPPRFSASCLFVFFEQNKTWTRVPHRSLRMTKGYTYSFRIMPKIIRSYPLFHGSTLWAQMPGIGRVLSVTKRRKHPRRKIIIIPLHVHLLLSMFFPHVSLPVPPPTSLKAVRWPVVFSRRHNCCLPVRICSS
jgi:hypothetical protein